MRCHELSSRLLSEEQYWRTAIVLCNVPSLAPVNAGQCLPSQQLNERAHGLVPAARSLSPDVPPDRDAKLSITPPETKHMRQG